MSSGDPFGFGQGAGSYTAQPTQYGPQPGRYAAPPPPVGGTTAFGSSPFDDSAVTVTGPPVVWLSAALATGVLAVLTASLAGSTIALAVLAWFAAGPVSFTLLAVHSRVDARRRALIYASREWAAPLYWTTLVVAFAGIVVSALRIADWVGRL